MRHQPQKPKSSIFFSDSLEENWLQFTWNQSEQSHTVCLPYCCCVFLTILKQQAAWGFMKDGFGLSPKFVALSQSHGTQNLLCVLFIEAEEEIKTSLHQKLCESLNFLRLCPRRKSLKKTKSNEGREWKIHQTWSRVGQKREKLKNEEQRKNLKEILSDIALNSK